jgi:competence protein ComEC
MDILFETLSGRAVLAMAGFLGGIALHSAWPFLPMAGWLVVALAVPAIATASRCSSVRRSAVMWAVSGLLCGWGRFDVSIPASSQGLVPWIGERVPFEARVDALLDSNRANVRIDRIGDQEIDGPGRRVNLGVPEKTRPGDRVFASCALMEPRTIAGQPRRRMLLARKGIFAECRPGSVSVEAVVPIRFPSPPAILVRWRQSVSDRIASRLPPEEAHLLAGMLYGDAAFGREELERFRASGLLHLVAVSGSNIGIVLQAAMAAAFRIRLPRRRATIVAIGLLLVFVAFVGPGASVLRAAVMGVGLVVARAVGRRAIAWHALLFAAFVLNAWNPWFLIFDAGFALSFLAMWGLLVWAPRFAARLPWIPERLGLREAAASTLGASIATGPYLAWGFGSVAFAGLVTNLLVAPLVPWIMLLGAVGLGGDLLGAGPAAYIPVSGLLRLVAASARWGASLDGWRGEVALPFAGMATTYLGMVWIQCRWRPQE